MRKTGRKTAAFIMVLLMLSQLCVTGLAAEPDEVKEADPVISDEVQTESLQAVSGDEAMTDEAQTASETDESEAAEENASVSDDTVSGNEEAGTVSDNNKDYMYLPKASYNLTFVAHNNGDTKNLTYQIPASQTEVTIGEFLNNMGKYEEVIPSMGGFLDINIDDEIVFWSLTIDGVASVDEYDIAACKISGGRDYVFTAHVCRKAAENIYVEITPKVYYDGRSHIIDYGNSTKSNAADLDLMVVFHNDAVAGADYRVLTYGTDYTVSYKNNKEPSLCVNRYGEYQKIHIAVGENPCVDIAGKGNYAGFSAQAYFDILPHNFSSSWPIVSLTGLKKVYGLKDGRISEKIDPRTVVKWADWSGAKFIEWSSALKKDDDYDTKLYRYDSVNNIWVQQSDGDPNSITMTGDYLYTLWGNGIKYCGVAFDGSYTGEFSDGTGAPIMPEHYDYSGVDAPASAAFQFKVSSDVTRDISNATVSLKKSSIKFDGKLHTGDDFGLKVSIGKGSDKRVLREGIDYTVTYDGDDFRYISSRKYYSDAGKYLYSESVCNAVYTSKIGIANKYKVTINAVEGSVYFGSKSGGTVTIKGVPLSTKGFMKTKPLVFNGNNSSVGVNVSKYGARNGLKYMSVESLGYDSEGNCRYLDNINNNPGYYSGNCYGFTTDYYNAAPGTYHTTLYAIGGGVTHGKSLQLPFVRKKISLKKAVQKGFVKLTIANGEYNAGGALPKTVTVGFCGAAGAPQSVEYNGDRIYTPFTNYMYTSFEVKASNNKKSGDGAILTLSNSNYFTGSCKFKYAIMPAVLSQSSIPVLNENSWYREYGKIEADTLSAKHYSCGELVAVMDAAKRNASGAALKPGIKLYQTYYKSSSDMLDGRLSLAQLKTGQYILNKKDEADGACNLEVEFSGTPLMTGFENIKLPVDLKYSEYETAAKITGATVKYNGKTYEFDAKSRVEIPYEGRQIRFDRETGDDKGVVLIKLDNGTTLGPDDFYVEYGNNLAAKKNGGSFKVTLKYNEKTKTYLYGGSATFKFTITDAVRITM